jgi:hypothetical protein
LCWWIRRKRSGNHLLDIDRLSVKHAF